MKSTLYGALALGLVAAPGASFATTFLYKQEAVASGTFNGTAFTNAQVTLTGTADPAHIAKPDGPISTLSLPLFVSINGIGSGQFIDSIVAVFNFPSLLAGFGDSTLNLAILFTNVGTVPFDLSTPFTPTSGGSSYNSGYSFSTTAGDFSITSANRSSFSITSTDAVPSVPEPATWAMLLAGFMGIGAVMRRRSVSFHVRSPITVQ